MAVVTGASSGIGARLAVDLAKRGAVVVAAARRADRLAEVIDSCRRWSPASRSEEVDLTVPGAPEELVERVLASESRVDVLVNNAGASRRVHGTRLNAEDVSAAMAVNFEAPVRAALAVLPSMRERGEGRIVNVASVAGRIGSPREAAYSASKFALVGWTESMAADLHGSGVRFHLVHPGPIDTEIWQTLAEPASYRGRFYPPEAVSRAIVAAVERDRFETWLPRWMSVVPFVRSALPGTYVKASGLFDRRGVGDRA